ncbi:MAG: DNA topoisomerase IV subunit A [Candidatus Diapherotrites archaeon]|uniref:Type 2 DNA topoisomerase 6 subunit A n=3 Tax=Candidatus Iainarchaeum sp. TaxID=3101447 RepID=A0A7J4JWK8_9ARCH|nr:DNA topoisomerase IV subunit A [Candidatus Diapherotrites archaeon]HIH21370.1 DNA topoisomerase IV subunit A [Candidatus Diapherotrites archaeon]
MGERDKEVKQKLENVGKELLKQIEKGENPTYELPVRTLNNVFFDKKTGTIKLGDKKSERQFLNIAHSKKFMQTMLVASEIRKVIDQNATVSIRDLYYALKHTIEGTNENTFEEQSESDPCIEDIEASLDLLREELHLAASAKGIIAGDVQLKDGKDNIDLAKMGSGGWSVPSNVEPDKIEFKNVNADYLLFIEKDAVWRRFNEDQYWKKHNCIILTGRGQPGRGERRLAQRLVKEYKMPIYVLTDADPWGMYIYSVIKQGSISLSYSEEKLATPSAQFIGLTTKDVETYKIPKEVTIKLNNLDVKRLKEMEAYEWFQKKEWKEEFKNMKEKAYKLELEALSKKGIRFITEKYVPDKIKNKEFLP